MYKRRVNIRRALKAMGIHRIRFVPVRKNVASLWEEKLIELAEKYPHWFDYAETARH